MSISIQRISVAVCAHAWNGDRTKVAICPNNNEVKIYKKVGNSFELETTLSEHDAVVTGIDWGKKTNRLLTCSQDRNAYVWTYEGNEWKPTLVILRINRAVTTCQWSPKEDKFAVGSGAKCVSICYFEKDNNWWVSKHIKTKIESTITSLDWHPNNILLACGGTDNKARVVSAFVKDLDNRKDVAGGTPFGSKLPFGTYSAEWPTGGWVQAIRWSPSGNQLAWVSHDSTVHFLSCATTEHKLVSVKYEGLPFRDFIWKGEDSIIAAGHDCNPTLFSGGPDGWKFDRLLDVGKTEGPASNTAKKMWENRANMGAADAGGDKTLDTKHQNCISVIRALDANTFSTTGLDGNLCIWPHAAIKL